MLGPRHQYLERLALHQALCVGLDRQPNPDPEYVGPRTAIAAWLPVQNRVSDRLDGLSKKVAHLARNSDQLSVIDRLH